MRTTKAMLIGYSRTNKAKALQQQAAAEMRAKLEAEVQAKRGQA